MFGCFAALRKQHRTSEIPENTQKSETEKISQGTVVAKHAVGDYLNLPHCYITGNDMKALNTVNRRLHGEISQGH